MTKKKINKTWIKKFRVLAKKYNVPDDLIDFYSLVDSSLSFDENKQIILEFITTISSKTAEVTAEAMTKREIEDKEADADREYIERVRKEERKGLEQLKTTQPKIEKYFKEINRYIEMVAKKYTNNLVISGVGGCSKSYATYKKLLDLGLNQDEDFVVCSGFTSPLELYNILFDHREGKIIVFDDIEGVLSSEKGVSILKGAMWGVGGNRVIEYHSTSEKLKKPSRAIFNSQLILILNQIPRIRDISIQALLSRSMHYTINFSLREMKEINYGIAYDCGYKDLKRKERLEVVNKLNEIVGLSTINYNIRTLFKAYDMYRYCRDNGGEFKAMVDTLIMRDERKSFVLDLLDERGISEEDRVKKFSDEFGLSRRTYFRIKRELIGDNGKKFWL